MNRAPKDAALVSAAAERRMRGASSPASPPSSFLHAETANESEVLAPDDVVKFVVGRNAEVELQFSKRALMRNSFFFHTFFIEHGADTAATNSVKSGIIVNLKHVRPRSAEAVLRLCHSVHHCDDSVFQLLLRECEEANEEHLPDTLRTLLSLYEACAKFELYTHADDVGKVIAARVTPPTLFPVLKTCARCGAMWPPEVRRAIGLESLLATCYYLLDSVDLPTNRHWRRLREQYPELHELMKIAATATTAAAASASPQRGVPRGGPAVRCPRSSRILWSPSKEDDLRGCDGGALQRVSPGEVASLSESFTKHLQQTEDLALRAQQRWQEMSADVAVMREHFMTLQTAVKQDEATAEASSLYLEEVQVYLQALRRAETEMHLLCTAAESPSAGVSWSAPFSSTLSVLHHFLQRVASVSTERRAALDELCAAEQRHVDELEEELAQMRAELS